MARPGGRAVCLILLAAGLLAAIIAAACTLGRAAATCPAASYRTAAVAADTPRCSAIGRDTLRRGGSPVDAAIAALLCTTVLNPQSMGLGGGGAGVTTSSVGVARAELGPGPRSPAPSTPGAYWIGVPGELRGYQLAHQRHGRLPWAQLFQPTIRLLREGLRVPRVLSLFLNSFLSPAIRGSSLGRLFFNGSRPLAEGEPLPWPELARTLETVAEKGADELYTGALAESLLADLGGEGGTLTREDLAGFQAEVAEPLTVSLGNYTLYTPPPPAGGALLGFVLNVLRGFRFSPDGKVDTYHRVVETLKFASGLKWALRDPRSHPEPLGGRLDLLSEELAQRVRALIGPRGDRPAAHYNVSLPGAGGQETGTSHVAVLGPDGSAVSATSTINTPFGSMVYSPRTGLILNNQLLDLCWRTRPDSGELLDPAPGERPPSLMVPSILLSQDRKAKLVIGGSGGEMILPATALAIMNNLWFGLDLHEAIKAKILHVRPTMEVLFEPDFAQEVQDGLVSRGHQRQETKFWLNVVQAVAQDARGCIYAESDERKLGEAAGY
uniref:Glutathione hydrolase 5 proenzyme n=1 Tax=Monodelphis domestica TaxID=13616 RepID=F6VDK3_MONDO